MFTSDYEENNAKRRKPEDHKIERITEDEKSLSYGIYSQLVAYEDHYNAIQNKLKGLTITWTLATFVGIGYLISGYEKALYIDVLLVIFFLCALSAQGVFFLWFLDAGLYESLIFSIWKEVYKLEEKQPIVGKSHHVAKDLLKKEKKVAVFHGVFYAYFIFILLIVGIVSLSIFLFYINEWMVALSIPIIVAALYLINRKAKKDFIVLNNKKNR